MTAPNAPRARFEWGAQGARSIGEGTAVIVVVDTLSFSTAVCVAVERGARVIPYRWRDRSAGEYADARGARLAGRRGEGALSLSPPSMASLGPGAAVVLPSPNGAECSLAAAETGAAVVAGCLRNATAAARVAAGIGGLVAVVGAGERWPDGSLRPAFEDMAGAGAVLCALDGPRSPEAESAVAVFEASRGRLAELLRACVSGRELIDAGYGDDVEWAAQLDASATAPALVDGAFVAHEVGHGPT